MKYLLPFLLVALNALGQTTTNLPTLTGANVALTDKFIINDVSAAGSAPMKQMAFSELVNVPGLFPNGSIPVAKISGLSTAATAAPGTSSNQPMVWNSGASSWQASDLVSATNFRAQGISSSLEIQSDRISYFKVPWNTRLYFDDPSEDRDITFPDRSGRVALSTDLGNVFLAVNFGVKADGVTDDTLTLQACIDAAAAVASDALRSVVILPRGTIMVRRTTVPNPGGRPYWKQCILLKNNVDLVGQGIDVTIIKMLFSTPSNTAGMMADNNVGGISKNITLKGFTFDSDAVNRGFSDEGEGINIKTGNNILLQDLKVINSEQDGLDLDGGTNLRVVGCIVEYSKGSGLHLVSTGGTRVFVSDSRFAYNGYARRVLEGSSLAGNGSGVDVMADDMIISNCVFENNAVEVQVFAGSVLMDGCVVSHSPTSLNLAGIVAGWTGLPEISIGSFEIRNCKLRSTSTPNLIEIIQNWPNTIISNSEINGKIVCTSGKHLTVSGNQINPGGSPRNGVHVVLASGDVNITGNLFRDATNHIRIESASGGMVSGNRFKNSGVDLHFTSLTGLTDNWNILNNTFDSTAATRSVQMAYGCSGATFIGNNGDNGGFSIHVGSGGGAVTNNKFIGNHFSTLLVDYANSTGNLFRNNEITGTITHSNSSTYAQNTWTGNKGAGCAGIFYGTATLTSGTATITSAASNSGRKFGLSRQSPNASTAIGNLSLGTVTAQTSFVVNALNDSAAVATGDLSSVYWEIIE